MSCSLVAGVRTCALPIGPGELLMVGSHGAEIGEPATGAAILSDASRAALAALTAAWPRLLVETKPHGLAVHYRPEPEPAPAVLTVLDDRARPAARPVGHELVSPCRSRVTP